MSRNKVLKNLPGSGFESPAYWAGAVTTEPPRQLGSLGTINVVVIKPLGIYMYVVSKQLTCTCMWMPAITSYAQLHLIHMLVSANLEGFEVTHATNLIPGFIREPGWCRVG